MTNQQIGRLDSVHAAVLQSQMDWRCVMVLAGRIEINPSVMLGKPVIRC